MAKKSYQMDIKIAGEIDKSLSSATKGAQSELQGIAASATKFSKMLNTSFSHFNTKGIDTLGNIADKAFKSIITGAKTAATAIGAITSASIMVGANFEEQMSIVQSISNVSAYDMELLSNKAKEMGANTKFSATESGQAFEYMAMAGWKTKEMLDGIEGVMNLAAGSGEDLGSVSDIVTDALTAFKLSAKDTNHFVDVLAAASSNANTNVAMLGESFKYAAPLAGAFNFSIEDAALMLGLMANSGIKASQSGTSLRKIFTALSSDIKVLQADGSLLTIKTSDQTGKMRSLRDIINDVRAAFSGMSEEQREAAKNTLVEAAQELSISLEDENGKLKTQAQLYAEISEDMQGLTDAGKVSQAEELAGKTGMAGLLSIINTSEEAYNSLAYAIDHADGAAERMATTRINNLKGDITILKSGMEGVGIEIYEGLNEPLREIVQSITKTINTFGESNFLKNIVKSVPTVRREMKQLGKSIKEGLNPLISVGEWFINNPEVLSGSLMGIGAAFGTFKAVKGVSHVVKSITDLSKLVSAWPIAVAGLAIGGIVGIATAIKTSNEKLKKENLAEHFGSISLSIEELKQVASDLLYTDSLGQITSSLEAMSEVDEINKNINHITKELDKANWKVSIGIDLDSDDLQSYQNNIDDFIATSQDAILQKQYATSLNLEIFTDDDAQGQKIREQFTTFYQNNYDTVSQLGIDLKNCVNASFEDGLLTFDEAKKIQELQKQIADMTQKLTASQFEGELSLLEMKYSAGELDAESFQNLQAEINEKMQEATKQFEEGYVLSVSNAKLMLDEGAIDKSEYDAMIEEFQQNYLQEISNLQTTAANFQVNTVMNAYSEELAAALPELSKTMDGIVNDAIYESIIEKQVTVKWDIVEIEKDLNFESLESSTANALSELFQNLKPSMEVLEETKSKYVEWGIEVPEAVSEGITNISALGALTKDTDAIWTYIGGVASSDEYKSSIEEVYNAGIFVPEQVIKAVNDKDKEIENSANTLYKDFCNHMKTNFGSQLNLKVPLNIATSITMQSDLKNIKAGNFSKSDMIPLPAHAEGGIFEKPHVALFAEEGPEAVIPLNSSKNAIALWQETGKLLGVYEENNYSKFYENISQAVTNPQIIDRTEKESTNQYIISPNIYLSASEEKNNTETLTDMIVEKIKQCIEQLESEKIRRSF